MGIECCWPRQATRETNESIVDNTKCREDNKPGSRDSDRGRLLYIRVVRNGLSEEVTFEMGTKKELVDGRSGGGRGRESQPRLTTTKGHVSGSLSLG